MTPLTTIYLPVLDPQNISDEEVEAIIRKFRAFEHPDFPKLKLDRVPGFRSAVTDIAVHGWNATAVADYSIPDHVRKWPARVSWNSESHCPKWLGNIIDRVKIKLDEEAVA